MRSEWQASTTSGPRYRLAVVQILRQIFVLSDHTEERISDTGEHRLVGEVSDAIGLVAVMPHQFDRKVGHGGG